MLIYFKYGINYSKSIEIVNEALSDAFNSKYAKYSYSNDLRSLDNNWKTRFYDIYNKINDIPISKLDIVNVGVGGGNEAVELFSISSKITFVDIARDGLNKIREFFPNSNTVLSSAENLSSLPNHCFDLYISLRTYNSSFFNIKMAISEAKRVLRHNSTIIISIANGFLCVEEKRIIPGLIIPMTNFVDIYRGFETANIISNELVYY